MEGRNRAENLLKKVFGVEVGLTAFEKKNSALDNTTVTGKTSERGKRNDTATPQSTVSDGKVANNSASDQEDGV